jgi:hypothetical protein
MRLNHAERVGHTVGEVDFVVCLLEIIRKLKLIILLLVVDAG